MVTLTASTAREIQTTIVFDELWRFASARQSLLINRISGKAEPWTTDPILTQYRFTNTYRFADRTSQFLIHKVIYAGEFGAEDVLYRILLFKIFNKIETWESLEREFGPITFRSDNTHRFDAFFKERKAAGAKLFSSAYIMPSGSGSFSNSLKHQSFLALLDHMFQAGLPRKVAQAKSLKDLYETFLSFPMLGRFLAYQFAIDVNYSELTDFSEDEFVVAGPGAKSGLVKCFGTAANESDLIRWVAERQDFEFSRLGLEFRRLFNRRLMLIDVQNLFCEIDKYSRVKHPAVQGVGNRVRIKRVFSTSSEPYSCLPVPKWELRHA